MFSRPSHHSLPIARIGIFLTASCFLATASAQVERYELGKRVERFELAWQSATPESRTQSVKPIAAAVQNFFSLRLNKAGEQLDQGFLAVTDVTSPTDFQRWALSQSFVVSPVLSSDKLAPTITAQLAAFYKVDHSPPSDAQVDLVLQSAEGTTVASTQIDLATLVAGHSWPLKELAEGDYVVHAKITAGEQHFEFPRTEISRLDNVQQQIESLDAATKDKTALGSPTIRASIRSWNSLIRSVSSKTQQETDYPLFQWMCLAEKLIAEPSQAGAEIRNHAGKSDCWLTLSSDGKNQPVRIRAPESHTTKLPVLFAFHGAGGSENMFFEAYGAGRTIRMAIERGWLVVAPRQSLLGMGMDIDQMLDELQAIFEIDRSKVLLMGHSMGAAQVIQQVAAHPDLPAAAAAIGGGRRIASADRAGNFPWFVAAGELDFGRTGAKALADSLEKAEKNVVYRDYPSVEHLVIVQAALDDVFSFFDSVIKVDGY